MLKKVPKEGEILDGLWWFVRQGRDLRFGLTEQGFEVLGRLKGISEIKAGDECAAGGVLLTLHGSESDLDLPAPGGGVVIETYPQLLETCIHDWEAFKRGQEDSWIVLVELEYLSDFEEFLEDEGLDLAS